MKDFLEQLFVSDKISHIEELARTGAGYALSGGGETSFYAALIACLFKRIKKNFVVILPDELSAETYFQDIKTFSNDVENVKFLPLPELSLQKEESVSPVMFERGKRIDGDSRWRPSSYYCCPTDIPIKKNPITE
ncbi:MAG: hypothetical protein ACOX1Z_01095 [Candidatus Ratteibacteria bacterium]